MKRILTTLLGLGVAALTLGASPAQAQYTMAKQVMAGGGGQSSGGSYTLAGTIGQHDPGVMSGGPWLARGGFLHGGAGGTTAVGDELDGADPPLSFQLRPAFPNPFLHQATLGFDLPTARYVRMRVFDASGRVMRTLVEGRMAPGRHSRIWNGADDHGVSVAAGVYFIRLEAESHQATRKVAVVR